MEKTGVRPDAIERRVGEGEPSQVALDPRPLEVGEACAKHAEREIHRDGREPVSLEERGVATRSAPEIGDARGGGESTRERSNPRLAVDGIARVHAERVGDLVVGLAQAPRDVVVTGLVLVPPRAQNVVTRLVLVPSRAQNVEIAQIEATTVVIAVPPAPIERSRLFEPSPFMPKAWQVRKTTVAAPSP